MEYNTNSNDLYSFVINYLYHAKQQHLSLYKTSYEVRNSGSLEADNNAAWVRGMVTMGDAVFRELEKK